MQSPKLEASSASPQQRLRIRVSSAAIPDSFRSFTPGAKLTWDNCQFAFNVDGNSECDFWIIASNAFPQEVGHVARCNTLFIAGEPPAKKIYPRGFYRQFGAVVDTHAGSRHANLHVDALGLPWLIGFNWQLGQFTLGYDSLKALPKPQKVNRVSVVCSTTAQTAGQRERLKFLAALKQQLGDELALFGKGFQQIDDKLEAVLPYRYHLVLENSQSPHYWTEKLTDAYLGWAFPLYVGCPNLNDYFSPESFIALNMRDVPGAVAIIRKLLAEPENPIREAAVHQAREKVLEVYNPFARFAFWANQLYRPAPKEKLVIRSEKAFRFIRGWFYRLQHRAR